MSSLLLAEEPLLSLRLRWKLEMNLSRSVLSITRNRTHSLELSSSGSMSRMRS